MVGRPGAWSPGTRRAGPARTPPIAWSRFVGPRVLVEEQQAEPKLRRCARRRHDVTHDCVDAKVSIEFRRPAEALGDQLGLTLTGIVAHSDFRQAGGR
jgi:hypothetical protein